MDFLETNNEIESEMFRSERNLCYESNENLWKFFKLKVARQKHLCLCLIKN